SWICLTCNAPATGDCFSKHPHALTRSSCGLAAAAASVGPRPSASRPFGRQRDARGRFMHEPREPVPEDERMAGEQLRAAFREFWFHTIRGARKPFARFVRLPFNTIHRYAKSRIDLPSACQRRVSNALRMIERGELRLEELHPGIPVRQLWASNRPSH